MNYCKCWSLNIFSSADHKTNNIVALNGVNWLHHQFICTNWVWPPYSQLEYTGVLAYFSSFQCPDIPGIMFLVFCWPWFPRCHWQIIAPILYWESTTFSRPAIALICFGAIALFPSVLLPSSPFMWLAGMTFGYFYGFLIITAGMSIGMSLPYFIGSAFHCRIHVSLLLSSFLPQVLSK